MMIRGLKKQIVITVFLMLYVFVFSAQYAQAIVLLTEREVLRRVFREMDEKVTEEKILSSSMMKRVKQKLGGKLVNYTRGKKASEIANQKIFLFYFGIKDGKRTSVAIILVEPGKWGPIKFLIHMGLDGTIKEMIVMGYTETRGRPIARRSFLRQFVGKTVGDSLRLQDDIVTISGATISSGAAAFTAKKAIVLYEELF